MTIISFLDYNIDSNDKQWINFKENYMVKLTLVENKYGISNKESFWVWIESITGDNITGIISNNLLSYNLEIGQTIRFSKNNIKEISNRSYTKEQTDASILMIKVGNNPITKYFESLNIRFSQNINVKV